ncbi:MAG: response regulator transcription factor [Bacteroidales bacterium]|nr:response regulator transcription factor [Bacteroidales bacterium]
MKTINCIIIDDERNSRDRLIILLQKFEEVKIVGFEGDPEKGIDLVCEKEPDIVFIDVEMPRKTGFEVVKEVKKKGCHPTFIFVTGYNQYAIKAIKSDAFDYILKPVDIDELKSSIERFKKCRKTINYTEDDNQILLDDLSDREKEIFKLLVQCKTSKEIGEELFISKNTVDTHRRKILEKTGAKNTQELILYASEHKL